MATLGLDNRDSSFFQVKLDESTWTGSDITKDIISFNITEEMSKMSTGSLVLVDRGHVYSKIFKPGRQLILSWGYNKMPWLFFLPNTNPLEAMGTFKRKGITAYIQNPSGAATQQGEITTSINFIATNFGRGIKQKIFTQGFKMTVIQQVLQEEGVETPFQFIDFKRMTEPLTPSTYVMQYENNFSFLRRMAFEWGAVFKISENIAGSKIALFAEYQSPMLTVFSTLAAQAVAGSEITLSYAGKEVENSTLVKSYTWQQQAAGSGDNVQILSGADGKTQFMQYKADTQETVVYKFNPVKIKTELEKKKSFSEKAILMKEYMNIDNFDTLLKKGFFTVSKETTAPQGIGLTMTAECLGNPMFTASMKINFTETQFPDIFCNRTSKFYTRKCDHKIDRGGYSTTLDICDAFTISGGSMI